MIETLTSLRFFLIALIYMHHLSYPYGFGPAGVTFFFVLSGFVMGYSYNLKFISLTAENLKHFYIKRFAKLYPLHILTFLISIPLVYLLHFKTNLFYAVSNIFLLQSYFPNGNQVFSFNALAWFLSDILFFYFLTPFILFLLHKFQIAKKTMLLLVLLLVLLVLSVTLALLFNNDLQPYSFGWWFVYISPYFRIFDYGIGLILGMIFIANNDFWVRRQHVLINKIVFSILEITSMVVFGLSFYWISLFPVGLQMGAYFLPFSIFMIYVFSFQRGIISSILSLKFFVYLGDLSFTIYLIHQLVISYAGNFFASPYVYGVAGDIKKTAVQFLLFFVIICISDVLVRYFEMPATEWLMHKLESRILPSQTILRS